MELTTARAMTPIIARLLKIDDTNHAVPAFFTFMVSGETSEESKIIADAIHRMQNTPYLLRAYAEKSPFARTIQSVVNLVGSFRESLEADLRLHIWKGITAKDLNPDFSLVCTESNIAADVIPVAYDGVVFTMRPVLAYGPNHRDSCDTCQTGKSLLQHSLSQLRNKVCYNLGTLKDGNFHFGDNPILDTDGMIPVDCDRDAEGNRIREFAHWFIATNEGPLTMADIQLTFEIGT